MKWNYKNDIIPILVIVAAIVLPLYFSPLLPESVPTHFNSEGMPDGYGSKTFLLYFGFGETVLLYLLLTFLPFIDPFWKKIEKKYTLFLAFRDIVLVFSLFVDLIILLSAKEGKFETKAFSVGFGMLFIVMGNYFPKLPRNFFFGIRTPWTLASDIVWKKTHILSGWLFVAAGILVIPLSFLNIGPEIALAVTLGPAVLISALIYPLYLYKKLQKTGDQPTVPEL